MKLRGSAPSYLHINVGMLPRYHTMFRSAVVVIHDCWIHWMTKHRDHHHLPVTSLTRISHVHHKFLADVFVYVCVSCHLAVYFPCWEKMPQNMQTLTDCGSLRLISSHFVPSEYSRWMWCSMTFRNHSKPASVSTKTRSIIFMQSYNAGRLQLQEQWYFQQWILFLSL